ncbi:karyopherin [Saxophila tyrrhenica]|uniref:Karyopherin n=1 Tax=Saxophila tyrrhenica TaxID=1690608 RepID=A0AAV9PKV3_9PEZI|nr:karyopherin [Saxophila tyrrhenica]
MAPFRLRIDGSTFRDSHNREVTLRGINVAGDTKYPAHPDVPSHEREHFFEGDEASFVDRPFSVSDAHTHFSRLRRWGFNTIRYVYTWEALEHAGPGKYDEDFIDHAIQILRIAKEYGFYIFMDPHQDVWSRFTGGSGAPMWTLYACGLDPKKLHNNQAAIVHNTWPDPATFPKMCWATNYQRLACQTMMTLFFAGKDFAPKCVIDGKNIQDWLQDHFMAANKRLAKRIHEAGDLEHDVVIGYESINEPNRGYVGHEDLAQLPEWQKLRKLTTPTAWQAMLTGSGRACEIETWDFGSFGPYKSGTQLVDPKGESAWLDPAEWDDGEYGWQRADSWKLGECIWAQHGVWDPSTDELKLPQYFTKHPKTGDELDQEYWTDHYFMHYYRAHRTAIRDIWPEAMMFMQSGPFEIPPTIKGTKDDDPNMVFASHFYDGITLIMKKWNRLWNVDVLGILRGRYSSPAFAIKIGETAIRNCFKDQLAEIIREGKEYMGTHPTVYTEIGIPYDMDDQKAYQTGDYSSQIAAVDANFYAVEGSKAQGLTWWVYTASNTHYWGDNWNGEDLSIYCREDRSLPSASHTRQAEGGASSSKLSLDPSSPSYSESQSERSAPVGPGTLQKTLSVNEMVQPITPSTSLADGAPGFRAAEAYIRPSPVCVYGTISSYGFDLKNCTFTLSLTSPSPTPQDSPTEAFLPAFHFPQSETKVEVSGGKWMIETVEQVEGAEQQVFKWWHGEGEQSVTIKGLKRKGGAAVGKEQEEGYLEAYWQMGRNCSNFLPQPQPHTFHSLTFLITPTAATMNNDGAFDTHWRQTPSPSSRLETIQQALHANLDPKVTNDIRQQALRHLEEVKHQPDAPHLGFTLADDWKQSDAVRYYGLQLLEYAVRYRWGEYNSEQTEQLRQWVKFLAGSIREQDALYIRNKVAQLWAEVAKRCWGDEWTDMDALLVTLWDKPISEKGAANKLLVLSVLETLSEDIINGEDAVAGLRLDVLGACLNDVMIPEGLHREFSAQQQNGNGSSHPMSRIRSGEVGWLLRMCEFFANCVKQMRVGGEQGFVRTMTFCAVKTLHALRPTMQWINLKGVVEANAVDCLTLPFHTDTVELQLAATEVLYVLLARPYGQHWHDSWFSQMQHMLRQDRVALLRQTFESVQIQPGEDEQKYTLQKKLSDVLSLLGDAVAQHPDLIKQNGEDPSAFFDLLLLVLQHKSLHVSIPVLHSWTKLMASQDDAIVEIVVKALGVLIQTCSSRMLRYESEPEDSEDETVQFLYDDFDTMPERHAFLGNYRRYCTTVIQSIAKTRPLEALSHVLGQMREMLEAGPYTGGRGFDSASYSKTNLPTLQFEAQYQVVSSTLKGYSMWLADVAALAPEDEVHARADADKSNTTQALQQWCYHVINTHSDDPEVAAQVLQTLVAILRTIRPEPNFVLHIVQHLLTMRLYDNPQHATYSEAVKQFEGLRVLELQKLAITFANELLEVYNELEPRIGVLLQKHSDDSRLVWGYKAFLFMIVHRAAGINHDVRLARLQQMLQPVYDAWQDQAFSASLSSLQTFCESLDLAGLDEFYKAHGFDRVADWTSQQLDAAGQARQASIKAKSDALPLRMTKSMLAATTEKLRTDSEEFDTGCALWGDVIPIILPNLLRLLRHAQAFHNMASWSHLPDEIQAVVRRTLQDRFWQSGISNETRDEFYARISGSKDSFEGFASTVRGTTRNIREQGYHLLYFMTKFEEQFYGIPDVAEPLADALFADAGALSANHLHSVINLATGLVSKCPPHYRGRFLPPLLTQLFNKMDTKISSEWEAIGHATQQKTEEDTLGDEMRLESVLRQLTFSVVSFVPFLLEFDTHMPPSKRSGGHEVPKPLVSDIVLADPTVLEPLMLFCTHALRMRDTRCCTTICRTFRTLVPLFQSETAPSPQVRDFMSTEVLKACITSLNEPYFADMQKDLAALIAQILLLYAPKTPTPREVLLSLPDVSAAKVDKTLGRICKQPVPAERMLRSLVLDLLEGVRGVSIHEAGKIAAPPVKKATVQPKYMEVEQRPALANGDDAGLESVADLFGGG